MSKAGDKTHVPDAEHAKAAIVDISSPPTTASLPARERRAAQAVTKEPAPGLDLSQVDDAQLLRALEQSRIVIRPDGKVVIENLTEDLLAVAQALNPQQALACDVPSGAGLDVGAQPATADVGPVTSPAAAGSASRVSSPTADTMRAVVITTFGGPEVLAIEHVELPALAPGHLRVAVRASALNRADLLQRRGLYPPPAGVPERIPGLEFAGQVVARGDAGGRFAPGDLVMGLAPGAAHAEFVVAHERTLLPLPRGMTVEQAGAVPEAFMTAFDALVAQAGLTHGDNVLIHAVGSGVGTAALQIAKAYGATTCGTSRTAAKLQQAAALGLDVGVHTGDGFGREQQEELLRAMPGGVDIVIDLVGGAYLEGNLRVLAAGGRMVTLGLMGGVQGTLDLGRLMRQRVRLMGSTLRARPLEEKIALAQSFEKHVLPGFERGTLRALVDSTFPMTDIAKAHAHLESDQTFGKVVVTW